MNGLVAVVYNDQADPRSSSHDGGTPPTHVQRDEIPVVEETIRGLGFDLLTLPVGENFLDTARLLADRSPIAVVNLCEDLLDDSANEVNFAALMDLMKLPFTGSAPLALGLCRDKGKTKALVRQSGIPTPDYTVVTGGSFDGGSLRFPLIVKPTLEDGSLGISDGSVVADKEGLTRRIGELSPRYDSLMVEEFIEGRELNAAIVGPAPERVLPLSEIDFSNLPPGLPSICGYEAKWESESIRYRGTVPLCPAPLADEIREEVERLSKAAFLALGMRDYGRIDWRLSPRQGLQFIEANPNPDISPSSGFMRSLRADGCDYPEFLSFLIGDAAARRGQHTFHSPFERTERRAT